MRITLSTPRRPGRARATRRPRSSRIGAVAGVSLAMANPMATARMANQITSPMVGARAGVQAAGEVANASTRLVTEFGDVTEIHDLILEGPTGKPFLTQWAAPAIMALLEEGVDLSDEIVQLIMPPDSFV